MKITGWRKDSEHKDNEPETPEQPGAAVTARDRLKSMFGHVDSTAADSSSDSDAATASGADAAPAGASQGGDGAAEMSSVETARARLSGMTWNRAAAAVRTESGSSSEAAGSAADAESEVIELSASEQARQRLNTVFAGRTKRRRPAAEPVIAQPSAESEAEAQHGAARKTGAQPAVEAQPAAEGQQGAALMAAQTVQSECGGAEAVAVEVLESRDTLPAAQEVDAGHSQLQQAVHPVVVYTPEELARAQRAGAERILVKGDLAGKLHTAFKGLRSIGAGSLNTLALCLSGAALLAPFTGGVSLGAAGTAMGTLGAALTATAIAAISAIGLALVIAVFKGYDEVRLGGGGVELVIKKGRKQKGDESSLVPEEADDAKGA